MNFADLQQLRQIRVVRKRVQYVATISTTHNCFILPSEAYRSLVTYLLDRGWLHSENEVWFHPTGTERVRIVLRREQLHVIHSLWFDRFRDWPTAGRQREAYDYLQNPGIYRSCYVPIVFSITNFIANKVEGEFMRLMRFAPEPHQGGARVFPGISTPAPPIIT